MKLSWLFRQSFVYFLGNVIRRAVGFLMIPVYTRFLRPAEYGVIELIELFLILTGVAFGTLGVMDAMIRLYHDETDAEQSGAVITTALLSTGLAGLAAALLGLWLAAPLSTLLFGDARYLDLIRVSLLAMLFSNLAELCLVYQRIRERAAYFVVFSLLQLALNLALNIYFIVFAGLGVWGFVLSKLVCSVLGAAAALAGVLRETRSRPRWQTMRKLFAFGGPLAFTGLSFFVIHFSDRFFLQRFGDLAQVGVYALAYKFAFLVTFLVGEPFGRVWNVTLYQRASHSEWKEEFSRVASYLAFSLFVVGLALSILAPDLVLLVADRAYWSAGLLIPVLVFGYVFREVGDFFRGVLFINKRVVLFTTITVACALENLALNFLLIGRYQAQGAAWATLLTWFTYMGACWLLAHWEHRIPYRVSSFTLLCAAAAGIYGLATLSTGLPMPWRFSVNSVWILMFIGLVWLLRYFPGPVLGAFGRPPGWRPWDSMFRS